MLSNLQLLYNIFRKMPKPGNLHIHISGFVNYKVLLELIIKDKIYKSLYIDNNCNISFYKEYKNVKYRQMTEHDVTLLENKIQPICNMGEMHTLGCVFYGLIKNKDFYEKYYLPEIINKMKRHNIKYMEMRVKLGSVVNSQGGPISILDELELLYKYNTSFSLIVQYNKCSFNIYDYFKKIILLVKGTKYESFIKGYDLTGDENKCYTIKFHYRKLWELANKYNIKYYFHAGEISNNSKSLINLEYALKLNPIRIGHGLVAFTNKKLLHIIKKNNVTMEICPISNKLIYNYKMNTQYIIDNIHNIVIGSDDDNKLCSNITHDYLYLYKKGLTLEHIRILLKNNIKFVPNYDEKQFNLEFDAFIDTYGKKIENLTV